MGNNRVYHRYWRAAAGFNIFVLLHQLVCGRVSYQRLADLGLHLHATDHALVQRGRCLVGRALGVVAICFARGRYFARLGRRQIILQAQAVRISVKKNRKINKQPSERAVLLIRKHAKIILQYMRDKFRVSIIVLFVVYFAVLMKLLIFRQGAVGLGGANFVPLKTILNYLNDAPSPGVALFNLAGNVMIFVPLGFLIPVLRRSAKWKTVLVAAFFISLAFETIQGIFRVGVFDVDDILLNVVGAFFGYLVFIFVKSISGNIDRSRN